MSKSEICRAIAEKLEPLKTTDNDEVGLQPVNYIVNDPTWAQIDTYEYLSPLGFWIAHRKMDAPLRAVNFFTDESANARLRDYMLERMSPREWFDYLIRGFVKLKSTDLAGGRYRMAQVFAICEFLKIDIGVIENV